MGGFKNIVQKIKCRILVSQREGYIRGIQKDFFGRVYYIVESGRDLLCLQRKEVKLIR